MAKVKFPLEMANGFMARNLGELIDNFDIKKIVGYFLDGKLQTWLEDRYYNDELEALLKIDEKDMELSKKLCSVFGIDSSNVCEIDTCVVREEQEKKEKIRQITDDEAIIDEFSNAAFSQKDLEKLYSEKLRKIYLSDDVYNINLDYEDVEYIGLKNNAVAHIDSEKIINFASKKIKFKNVRFDDDYEKKRKTGLSKKSRIIIDENKIVYITTTGKLKCITLNKSMTCTEKNIELANNEIESPIVEIHRQLTGTCLAHDETYALLDSDGNIYYFDSKKIKLNKIMIDGVYNQICLTSGTWGPVLCALNDKNEVITCEVEKYNGECDCNGYCEKKEMPPIYKMNTKRHQDVLGIDCDGRVHILYSGVVDKRQLEERKAFLDKLPCTHRFAGDDNYLAWIEDGSVGFVSKNDNLGYLKEFNTGETVIDLIYLNLNSKFAILYSSGKVDWISPYLEGEKDVFKIPLMMLLDDVVDAIKSVGLAFYKSSQFALKMLGVTEDGYLCTEEGICEVKDINNEIHKIRLF